MKGCSAAIAKPAPAPPPTSRGRRDAGPGLGAALALLLTLSLGGGGTVLGAEGNHAEPVEATLESVEGGKLRLEDYRGAPLLIELWATWCAPCKEQAAILEGLREELAEAGVQVLAVDQGEKEKRVREYLAEHPKSFPVALDRAQVLARKLDIYELPVLALLDAEGRVVGRHLGLAEPDEVRALLSRN